MAIVIFGIVAATVFASYRAVFHQTEQLEAGASRYAMGKSCLDRIQMDLFGLYISMPPLYTPPSFNSDPDPFRIVGEQTSGALSRIAQLQFASREHLPFGGSNEKGVARIVYYADESRGQGPRLRRADDLYPFKAFEKSDNDPILCNDVLSLTFSFKDAEGEEHESWDSESRQFKYATPKAVGIRLELGDKDDSVVFSTRVTLPVYRIETQERSGA